MLDALVRWVDERLPVRAILGLGTNETIPGGARFAYALGSATLFAFALQVVSGCIQLFYYVPTVDHAYDSLMYLRMQIPFGWLLHGLHYWGANAMVVLVGLHTMRVFVWGAYKRPRELTWLIGVALLAGTAAIMFTGAPLPWDERGYWAAEVGSSMVGTTPVIGTSLRRLLRGGEATGQLALSRFFVLHVAILPAALGVGVLLHLLAFRMFGSVGPWRAVQRREEPLWPEQVARDVVVAALLLVLLVGLAAFEPPPITGPADPLDASYVPKPEWNFLFLYKGLQLLPGSLEALGTVGVPLLGLLLLGALPFLDRGPERDPAKRPFAMTGLVLVVGSVAALSVAGLEAPEGAAGESARPREPQASARAQEGAALFATLGCGGCHRADGGALDLSAEGARGRSPEWLAAQIRAPAEHVPGSTMPAHPQLSAAQLEALVAYLESLRSPGAPAPGATAAPPARGAGAPGAREAAGRAAEIVGSAIHGATLYTIQCSPCHGEAGRSDRADARRGNVPPLVPISRVIFSPEPEVFAAQLDRWLQHGAAPAAEHPGIEMPAFGDTDVLTQQQIADIEAYVMSRNGVARGGIVHPGIRPAWFAAIVALLFGGAGLLFVALSRRRVRDSSRGASS